MLEGIVCLIVGIIFVVIGFTNFKGNLKILHSYHYNNVKKEDLPIFAKKIGIGVISIGIGISVSGILTIISDVIDNELLMKISYVFMIIILIVVLPYILFTIRKYNKKIFG